MKFKFLVPIFLGVFLGFLIGKVLFNNYNENNITVFQEGEKVYFLKSSVKLEDSNFINMDEFSYIGISLDNDVINKLKDYYIKDYKVEVEEKYINNYDFITVLKEYDKISKLSNIKDLIKVQDIVLSNYKEMVLEDEY